MAAGGVQFPQPGTSVPKRSLKTRFVARTSVKRASRAALTGVKAPRGMGWFTNPKKAAYNRLYNRASFGCMILPIAVLGVVVVACFAVRLAGH